MFNFNFDKKTIVILIVVMAALSIMRSGTSEILSIILSLPGVIVAMTFHEYAHALAAYKLGDETPKLQGRLNLNPLSHIDPIGIALLIFAGFGWGRPVEINPRNFDSKHSLSKAEAIVAAAGPLMNFFLAFVFSLLFYVIFMATNVTKGLSSSTYTILYNVVIGIIYTNIGLGVFNLIPLPPLDGSKVLMHFLGYKAKQWFYNNEQIFYIIFLVLWITGMFSVIISPVFDGVFNVLTWLAFKIVSIFM